MTSYLRPLTVPGRYTLDPSQVADFKRASSATYRDPVTGVAVLVGNNVPRFEQGQLLLELGTTNLFLNTTDFSSWSKTRSTLDAPDAQGWCKITEDTTASNSHLVLRNILGDFDTTYVMAVDIKAGARTVAALNFGNFVNQVDPRTVFIDLITGQLTPANLPEGRVSAVAIPGGGWRVSLNSTTVSSGSAILSAQILMCAVAGSTSYTGDGVSDLFIRYPQAERSATPSSYIPTPAAILGLRAAESAFQIVPSSERPRDATFQQLQLAVNSNIDLYVDAAGNIATVTDLQSVLQACEQAARTMVGSMQYAPDVGMPNFNVLWSGSPNLAQFNAALRRELSAITGVTGVQDISSSMLDGVVSYSATIITIYGTGRVNNNG